MPQGKEEEFGGWKLEYGAGIAPTEWHKLKEGTEPIPYDPWAAGKLKWDLNKEPQGNITNWAVGLGSYQYDAWRENLNGLYTLRLSAWNKKGKTAETRQHVYVGEAVVRSLPGTAHSADTRCRLIFPVYAFPGDVARVVCVLKQVPANANLLTGLTGAEDTRETACDIYTTIPPSFALRSPIYRLLPNGLLTDPPASIEIDYNATAMAGLPGAPEKDQIEIRQWSPILKRWQPLPTQWFNNTAKALIPRISEYEAYVGLFYRSTSLSAPDHWEWIQKTALIGSWRGMTDPYTKISIGPKEHPSTAVADENGLFELPIQLDPKTASYPLEMVPLEGEKMAYRTMIQQSAGQIVTLRKPKLFALPRSVNGRDFVLITAEDPALEDFSVPSARSVLVEVMGDKSVGRHMVELSEQLPGTGFFTGELDQADAVDAKGTPLAEPMRIVLGANILEFRMSDTQPPQIILTSPTDPCLLFANPGQKPELESFRIHSLASVTSDGDAWKISGIDDEPSARMVRWPVTSFPPASWPFIGFSYRLKEPAPWQLHFRSGNSAYAYYFGTERNFPVRPTVEPYGSSQPLMADGEWHYWQGSLTNAQVRNIDMIAFGSWLDIAWWRPEAGFRGKNTGIIEVKNLFVGKSFESHDATMEWKISDYSGCKSVRWWVDEEPNENAPSKDQEPSLTMAMGGAAMESSCNFTLPKDGRWFFHLQATDTIGNAATRSYPLYVYSSDQPEQRVAGRKEATWEQPDGNLDLPLPGMGLSLNAKKVSLIVNGRTYPVPAATWDSSQEVLTVNKASFAASAPLGFDGEKLEVKLAGEMLNGQQLTFPVFDVMVKSPFLWQQTEKGGILKIKDFEKDSEGWITAWDYPDPPWKDQFPESVNNVLILKRPLSKKGWWERDKNWEKPLIVKEGAAPIYFLENWNVPRHDEVAVYANTRESVFSLRDKPTKPLTAPAYNGSWIYALQPGEPFESDMVRITTFSHNQLIMRRVSCEDAMQMINQQKDEAIRIDAWIPPGGKPLQLGLGGSRIISYAFAGDSSFLRYKKAATAEDPFTMESREAWEHAIIVITPDKDYRITGRTYLSGEMYW